jgi:hypothetical protein
MELLPSIGLLALPLVEEKAPFGITYKSGRKRNMVVGPNRARNQEAMARARGNLIDREKKHRVHSQSDVGVGA